MQWIKRPDKIQIVEQPATCPQLASRAPSSTPQQGVPIIVAISLSICMPIVAVSLAIGPLVIIFSCVTFSLSTLDPNAHDCHHQEDCHHKGLHNLWQPGSKRMRKLRGN